LIKYKSKISVHKDIKMFRKLISNLPFQPTLLAEVAHYSNRLKQEQSVRRLGVLILLIGFGLQLFIIAFPPQSSLATNRSDIIYGAKTKQDVLSAYRNNQDTLGRKDIKAIFNYYGIKESQIERSTSTTVKDNESNYINTSRSTTRWADTFINIPGAVDGGIYEFPLSYWRKEQHPNGYPAITGISEYGFRFWILLKGCGNIVYEKGAKKPNLEISKTLTTSININEGDEVKYDIRFRNSGPVSADNIVIKDSLPEGLEFISQSSTADLDFSRQGRNLVWKASGKNGSLGGGTKWQQISLATKATSMPNKQICNISTIESSNAIKKSAQSDNCVTVSKPKCPGSGLPIPPEGIGACKITCTDGSQLPYDQTCPVPQIICSSLKSTVGNTWNERIYKVNTTMQPGGKIKSVNYYKDGIKIGSQANPGSDDSYSLIYSFSSSGEYIIKADVEPLAGEVQPSSSCSLTDTIKQPSTKTPILITDKFVKNETQKIDNANNTIANPSDILIYNLTITNKGTVAAVNLPLDGEYSEDIRDILEYAKIIDLGDANFNKETSKLSWPAVTINPEQTITKTFSVEVLNPLPATPVSVSNPLSFDFSMHNKYGRAVVVNLKKPVSKTVEESVSTLPNTGPSTGFISLFVLVVTVGYFYYRNRLLSKELIIVQKEFQSGV
jgi:uncharacterized repeat protein (TIGR01451 family)